MASRLLLEKNGDARYVARRRSPLHCALTLRPLSTGRPTLSHPSDPACACLP
jgi:hypothetical protein